MIPLQPWGPTHLADTVLAQGIPHDPIKPGGAGIHKIQAACTRVVGGVGQSLQLMKMPQGGISSTSVRQLPMWKACFDSCTTRLTQHLVTLCSSVIAFKQ